MEYIYRHGFCDCASIYKSLSPPPFYPHYYITLYGVNGLCLFQSLLVACTKESEFEHLFFSSVTHFDFVLCFVYRLLVDSICGVTHRQPPVAMPSSDCNMSHSGTKWRLAFACLGQLIAFKWYLPIRRLSVEDWRRRCVSVFAFVSLCASGRPVMVGSVGDICWDITWLVRSACLPSCSADNRSTPTATMEFVKDANRFVAQLCPRPHPSLNPGWENFSTWLLLVCVYCINYFNFN